MYKDLHGNSFIVVPDFLSPGRKYPCFVYFYAIILYSSKPSMSQRAVAEATREKFNLPTFSHSTVGRVFKAFEKSIKETENVLSECEHSGAEAPVIDGNTAGYSEPDIQTDQKRRFPSVRATADRRRTVHAFINSIVGEVELDIIVEISRKIVKYWYDKNKRLLI